MIAGYYRDLILEALGHAPTDDQRAAAEALASFDLSPSTHAAFILRGYAGTGKTSLVSAFVRTLRQLQRPCVLLAPTGRAAKVFSQFADLPAYTIHKRIYRQRTADFDAEFSLGFNGARQVLFLVDEASMISDTADSGSERESLLDDLLRFVYGGDRACRLVLVGDSAQLPPVGAAESPALQPSVLERRGLSVQMAELKQVVRQEGESGILCNATRLRQLIERGRCDALPRIRFAAFADVRIVPGDELIETLAACYSRDGMDDTRVVCRSNKRAVAYNNGIRSQILGHEDLLSAGEEVMIAKNNYFLWQGSEQVEEADFLANGDRAVVERVKNVRELYGFRFADCTLALPDYGEQSVVDCIVLLDTLFAEAPALSREQQLSLYEQVLEDYADLPTKRERLKALRQDRYYNAVQLKYAYAVTCHKAQGGQWGNIFIDQGYLPPEQVDISYLRWLYTALTRATRRVFFVNWREEQTETPMRNEE